MLHVGMTAMEKPTTAIGKFSCLIVEDDSAFAGMAAEVVRGENGRPTLCNNLAEAQQAVASNAFDLALLDNNLPDGKGYNFFDQLQRRNPAAPIIMVTGAPDLGEAVSLTRNGLFEYLTKPVDVDALVACLQRAKLRLQSNQIQTGDAEWFSDSAVMREVLQQLRQASKHSGTTVLLTGETGSGKDVAARMLHQLSFAGKTAPFIAVNCGAIPAEMFESELFGAERGAYTGADKRRTGLVAAANNGTLFLDEIGEVPLALQPKLLRLLEAKEYRILGSTESQSFGGRFVTATNKDLSNEVKTGRFREDLLYRLDVFSIELPPLRRRRSEIPGLTEFLLTQLTKKYNRNKPLLRQEDVSALTAHDFPGNVRELRNVLERSLLKTAEDSRWLALDLNWLNRATQATTTAPANVAPAPAESLPAERNGLTPIEAQEYRLIRDTLHKTHGGIRRAAARLGLSPQALLRRLEKWPELRGARE
jgi:DNA-binding NtrC family response regulator